MARLSVHSIPVTDARNEETMHGFARRIEATPPGQCALALQLSLLEASALQTCGKCVPCRDGLPQLAKLMRRIVEHTAAALGAEAELTDYTIANYKVENDVASSERCRQAVIKCLGPTGQGHYRGTLSGEDFSEYLRRVPGVLAFVGTRNPKIGATYAQHSCFYKIDETVLAKGSMVAAQYAIDFLAEPTQEELDGPAITAVAETNPDLAAKLRSAKATTAEARDAIHDARTARRAAIKGIHEARAAARREEKHDE